MFDYFKANEQEQYLFLQLPLMLIKDEQFKGLSDSAKILYSLLLNRTSLSAKNGWTDEQGNVYIIYTLEEIMADLNCWEKKATKAMKELKEIGLVKSIRQGLGRPNIIYVMNFATALKYKAKEPKNLVNTLNCQKDNSRTVITTELEPVKRTIQELPEGQSIYIDLKKDLQSSYTDSNQIESNRFTLNTTQPNETDTKTNEMRYDRTPNQSVMDGKEQKNKESFQNATVTSDQHLEKPSAPKYSVADVEETIKGNICYEYILMDDPHCEEMLDGVLHVIVSTIMTDFKDGYISMGEENVPAELVKSVFFKLTKEDIEYFIENFNRQTDPTIKLKPYIRTSLYRNHGTNNFYWTNRVHVDMPQLAEKKIKSKTT